VISLGRPVKRMFVPAIDPYSERSISLQVRPGAGRTIKAGPEKARFLVRDIADNPVGSDATSMSKPYGGMALVHQAECLVRTDRFCHCRSLSANLQSWSWSGLLPLDAQPFLARLYGAEQCAGFPVNRIWPWVVRAKRTPAAVSIKLVAQHILQPLQRRTDRGLA